MSGEGRRDFLPRGGAWRWLPGSRTVPRLQPRPHSWFLLFALIFFPPQVFSKRGLQVSHWCLRVGLNWWSFLSHVCVLRTCFVLYNLVTKKQLECVWGLEETLFTKGSAPRRGQLVHVSASSVRGTRSSPWIRARWGWDIGRMTSCMLSASVPSPHPRKLGRNRP